MNENKSESDSLYMPSNVSTEKEALPKINNKEIKYLISLYCFGAIVGIIVSIFTNFQIGAIVTVPIFIFSYMLCMKNPVNNCSTMTYLVGIYNFYSKKQNKYQYKYTEWWEKYLDEEK